MPYRRHRISELSTGTRRVVDLAVIAASGPRLLFLDEPTAGIAQREAEAFGPLLRRLHELTGATIILVEHDVPLAASLCDRLIVLEAGRVVSPRVRRLTCSLTPRRSRPTSVRHRKRCNDPGRRHGQLAGASAVHPSAQRRPTRLSRLGRRPAHRSLGFVRGGTARGRSSCSRS